ncbi:hypothetical protein [Chromobacterium aquaticum]|uniref:Uncharacterized protein n=1 Tax=Chromobacterium aquaticum TaxID=467180 RepID=A0ABV9A0N1_9NEIS|nr:hypothetical protein [Chromobacterium aquaticum]MCD5360309.1 hypothetical protein [Chromobacterium aquaticum]
MKIQIVGMSWYRPETFAKLRAMFEDGDKLHNTYEEWFAAAEMGRKRMEAKNIKVICVDIDPDEFPKWCKENKMKLNAEARNKFSSLIAYKIATE